ncbi:hypothetical protein ACFQY0_08575 [Haloferula chungangensis]|uniref:Uncharacterized protein n=1 Tax=Haloferula chungangensis TaxID=1048331 RepID=A0ABW2L7S0_9BACT
MNWYRVALLAWLLTLVSCGLGDGEGEEEKEVSATAPRLVGQIASINEGQRFVLVEGYGEWKLGEGLLLSSFGGQNERSATLIVSGERMGRYTAADWKSGELKLGDQVYARPLKSEAPESSEFVSTESEPVVEASGENFEKSDVEGD